MGILVFGAGKSFTSGYARYWLEQLDILAVIDNDITKQGSKIFGYPILPPADGLKLDYECIYILGKYANEMFEELIGYGVERDKIKTEKDIYKEPLKFKPLIWYGMLENEVSVLDTNYYKNRTVNVLLISYDLGCNGAMMALVSLAKALRKLSYNVTVASGYNGIMRNELVRSGFSVIWDCRLLKGKLADLYWIECFDMVWVNTAQKGHILLDLGKYKKPVIWWVHEPDRLYKTEMLRLFKNFDFRQMNFNKIHVYGVSPLACEAFTKNSGSNVSVNELVLGVEDFYDEKKSQVQDDKFVFAVLANIVQIKAQDVFLEAIEMLPESICDDCEFWLIGWKGEDEWGRKIQAKAVANPHVRLCGAYTRSQIVEAFHYIDAVVVPSHEETLSLAAVEGMMNKKGIICSDESAVGIAKFVKEYFAGILIPPANAKCLSAAMTWVLEHRDEWTNMGENGRKLYEEAFSISAFSHRVKKVVDSLM